MGAVALMHNHGRHWAMRASAFGAVVVLATCMSLGGSVALAAGHAVTSVEGDEDAIFAAAVEATRRRDFLQAYDLFEALADTDVADAQYNLAVLLRLGRGRPQNFRMALFWAWLSHLGDEPRAVELAQGLAQTMPPEILAQVASQLRDRLEAQLDRGERGAILKYARLHSELMDPSDSDTAYVWFSIGTALGVVGAVDYLSALTADMEMPAILAAQIRAETVFAQSAFTAGALGAETPQKAVSTMGNAADAPSSAVGPTVQPD